MRVDKEAYSKHMTSVKYFSARKRGNSDFKRREIVALKKLCVMMLCTFLLTLAFSGVGKSAPEETKNVYHIDYGGLTIDITAPIQAYPGENISITVTTEAVTQIDIEYIYVEISGLVNATTEVSLSNITHIEDSPLTFHEEEYDIAIPDNLSSGLTYGCISCEWEFMGSPEKIPLSGFALTYIENVALEQLQAEYDELNATHQSIFEEYTELKAGVKKEVDSTQNLMYVFIITTVVASITVFVLLMRKPKKVWV